MHPVFGPKNGQKTVFIFSGLLGFSWRLSSFSLPGCFRRSGCTPWRKFSWKYFSGVRGAGAGLAPGLAPGQEPKKSNLDEAEDFLKNLSVSFSPYISAVFLQHPGGTVDVTSPGSLLSVRCVDRYRKIHSDTVCVPESRDQENFIKKRERKSWIIETFEGAHLIQDLLEFFDPTPFFLLLFWGAVKIVKSMIILTLKYVFIAIELYLWTTLALD